MALQKIHEIVEAGLPIDEVKEAIKQSGAARLDHAVGSLPSFAIESLRKEYDHIVVIYPETEAPPFLKADLDALDSDRGRTILEELKKDPQRKIRTYTNWALERHQARRL